MKVSCDQEDVLLCVSPELKSPWPSYEVLKVSLLNFEIQFLRTE